MAALSTPPKRGASWAVAQPVSRTMSRAAGTQAIQDRRVVMGRCSGGVVSPRVSVDRRVVRRPAPGTCQGGMRYASRASRARDDYKGAPAGTGLISKKGMSTVSAKTAPPSRRPPYPPSRWAPASGRSRSPSSSPRTATCSASTIRARRSSPASRKRSTTRSTPPRRPASCPRSPSRSRSRRRNGTPPPASQATRFRVTVTDNGPGIVRQQIPPIFAKLLYGSKFHRLRMSRGQQGIGISAAGMYAQLTTGKPVQIISRTGPRAAAHYFEVQIDTKKNEPRIFESKKIDWEHPRGTQVTLEIEGRYQKGRASVDEYLEQTAIANPHVELVYHTPEGETREYPRTIHELPPQPREIKPHPYGIEFGMLLRMLHDTRSHSLSRVPRRRLQPGLPRGRPGDLQDRQALAGRAAAQHPRRRTPRRSTRPSRRPRSWRRRRTASRPSARRRSSTASTSRSRASSTRR